MNLQAAVPRTRSIFDFQQIVRPRMLYILLNVNAAICNNQQVSKRMNSHRFDINNFDSQGYASNVALHFNSYPHSIADFSVLPIDVVKDEMFRLCKETYWIHKLDTLHPKGMNSKLLYDV